jgi:hypothetical protein
MGNKIVYVLSDLDRLCIVAKECYGADGAVLATPGRGGDFLPEVAQIPQRSYDQESAGSDQLMC